MAQIGTIIEDRYRIIDKIGEGGMSIVWLASDMRLNKTQAIKEVKENANSTAYRVSMNAMKREAAIMKDLDHPALPRIIDVLDYGNAVFVVMDYISGKDLSKVLKEHLRTITEEDVIDWGIQLCDALGSMHNHKNARGESEPIVYRDMKPGNVVLGDDNIVKIIDFGIARIYKTEQSGDTTALGTRGYAPPEAFKSGLQTDPRSDIYSLGVTLFHLVTGHSPMEFVDRPTLPPIRSINPALSEGLERIIIRSTQWDPALRYQSCEEMKWDLENYGDLTEEARRRKKRKLNLFKGLAVAGAACLVLGIGCMVSSSIIRGSSYSDIMERAAVASAEEIDGQASNAELLYTEAIAVSPGEIEPYTLLVNKVYKDDSLFTTSEASRWNKLFEENKSSIDNSKDFGKLCYDAGVDYFIYYNYGDELTRGSQAVNWFNYAMEDYDARERNNQESTLTAQERNAAEVYKTIGEFSQTLSQSIQEGTEGESYAEYWDALEQACGMVSDDDPVVVRLRLYNVVFQAINSPVYLSGFRRADVNQDRVTSLLNEVLAQAEALEGEAQKSELTADLQETVVEGYSAAYANVQSTYNSVGAQMGKSSSSSSSSGEAKR